MRDGESKIILSLDEKLFSNVSGNSDGDQNVLTSHSRLDRSGCMLGGSSLYRSFDRCWDSLSEHFRSSVATEAATRKKAWMRMRCLTVKMKAMKFATATSFRRLGFGFRGVLGLRLRKISIGKSAASSNAHLVVLLKLFFFRRCSRSGIRSCIGISNKVETTHATTVTRTIHGLREDGKEGSDRFDAFKKFAQIGVRRKGGRKLDRRIGVRSLDATDDLGDERLVRFNQCNEFRDLRILAEYLHNFEERESFENGCSSRGRSPFRHLINNCLNKRMSDEFQRNNVTELNTRGSRVGRTAVTHIVHA